MCWDRLNRLKNSNSCITGEGIVGCEKPEAGSKPPLTLSLSRQGRGRTVDPCEAMFKKKNLCQTVKKSADIVLKLIHLPEGFFFVPACC